MLKVFIDSGSSIKQDEAEKYKVDIIPLQIMLGEKEYLDGVNLSMEEFYHALVDEKIFPKTSLPNLVELEKNVLACTDKGDDVIIITISSKISSTNESITKMFENNPHVRVIDSRMAVGGMRLMVDEINRNRDKSLDEIVEKVNALIPRIKIMAIPETLEYLFRGGRLARLEWIIGSMLKIRPIIGFKDGNVHVHAKKMGTKNSMSYIANALKELDCDTNYNIIASYTYSRKNLDELVSMVDQKYLPLIRVYDELDPAIAAHWGPNAYGLIFVANK